MELCESGLSEIELKYKLRCSVSQRLVESIFSLFNQTRFHHTRRKLHNGLVLSKLGSRRLSTSTETIVSKINEIGVVN